MIELGHFGTAGLVLFLIILVIMELFFCVISGFIASVLGFSGILWWILGAGLFIILNCIFVSVN